MKECRRCQYRCWSSSKKHWICSVVPPYTRRCRSTHSTSSTEAQDSFGDQLGLSVRELTSLVVVWAAYLITPVSVTIWDCHPFQGFAGR
nr:hypothetical protein CFP56_12104 [Quercus suber]